MKNIFPVLVRYIQWLLNCGSVACSIYDQIALFCLLEEEVLVQQTEMENLADSLKLAVFTLADILKNSSNP